MPPENIETGFRTISAPSRRELMDWSLVLASQQIEATLEENENGFQLIVAETDFQKAQRAIELFRAENRPSRWTQTLPGSGLVFHWGSLFWCFAVIYIFFWSGGQHARFEHLPLMDNKAVAAGQWWRIFTAITLHADLAHLAGNVTTGFLLIGLAMARYGVGFALVAAYLAGAFGNFADYLFYDSSHRSLGASGMVLGALGLVAFQVFSWRDKTSMRLVARGLAATVFIFILMGTSPQSDVTAHLGGFAGGVALGFALNHCPSKGRGYAILDKIAVLAVCFWVIFTWSLFLRK